MLLIVLLIGLGFLTVKYTPLDETLLGFFKSSTGGTTSTADTTKPVISDFKAIEITTTKATITWTTDDLSSSQVEYGKTKEQTSLSPAQPADDPTALDAEGKPISAGVVTHSVTLTGLEPNNITYYYRVKSKDAAGNEAVSPASEWKSFTTTVPEE
ncbi:MAG: fibronectin type III domain-containing protein [Chloroflexi bacterium]|nr:fibronectin type III domain-containing protein [Chloroflexota bacterium]